jgi:hypothetical protein
VTCLRVRFEKGWGSSVASGEVVSFGFALGGGWVVKPPLRGIEGVVYAEVAAVARAAIGFADESCREERVRVMKSRKCCNEGIARYEKIEMGIVKSKILVDVKYV